MYHVLLVDDDEMVRTMMQLRLTMTHFQVDTAENGLIGVQKALKKPYDAILMDMHMPIMDGHDATIELRKAGYQGLIIAVTASVRTKDADAALTIGCNHFISKPIEADFETCLMQCIEQYSPTID